MQFDVSPEQTALLETVRRFVAKEVPAERARTLDEGHEFPWDTWKRMGEQGWLGLPIPEEHGGSGASLVDVILFAEQLSHGLPALAAGYQRCVCYGGLALSRFGTEEQRERVLAPLIAGTGSVAVAISEPEAGSDAASIRTKADRQEGGWTISGQKVYSSGAQEADWVVAACRTGEGDDPRLSITTFLVPLDRPGITVRPMNKLGNWMVSTCEIWFDDVAVGDEDVLGEVNGAWATTLSAGLDAERIFIGAMCTGAAQKCLDLTVEQALTRHQFGKPLASFQMTKQKLADMDVAIQSARLLTYFAASRHDVGAPTRKAAAQAKLAASETWNRVAYDCLQIFGGAGYMMDGEIQRHLRDARLYTIGGGTSEIQRLIISHELTAAATHS